MNTFKWILTVVMGALCVLIIGGSMHGCSGNPKNVVGTAPYVDPRGEVLDFSDPLAELLCQRWGRCGTVRVMGGPIPAEAMSVGWVESDGAITASFRKGNGNWNDCDPLTDVHCWLDTRYAIPLWRCTFGDCPTPPTGQ